jgi:AhpC/TSA antioxidant enzyme
MISIGKPEIGKELVSHLGLTDGAKWLFVDPENVLYDALLLNRGVKETFFSISTPFSFLDRFKAKDGMKELLEVLSKWNQASYLPPKQSQAFNQGGTFIFNGFETVFAHYDESTGAHANVGYVKDLAIRTTLSISNSLEDIVVS